jgi:plastocyanin
VANAVPRLQLVKGSVRRRAWRIVPVAMIIPSALALAACGGSSTSGGATPTAIVKVNDGMSFIPSTLTIAVGTTDLKIENVGSIPHNLAIPALNISSPTVNGGETVTVAVHAKTPGRYPFVCTLHVMNGMVGTLVVRAGSKG